MKLQIMSSELNFKVPQNVNISNTPPELHEILTDITECFSSSLDAVQSAIMRYSSSEDVHS